MSDKRAEIMAWLAEQEALCATAIPGPWEVWPTHDHPGYEDGTQDLIVGAGDGALMTVEGRTCRRYSHETHPVAACEQESAGPVCVLGPAVEAEQRATAAFVASARTVLPQTLAAIRATVGDHRPVPVTVRDNNFEGTPVTVYPCEACDHDFDRSTGAGCPTVESIHAATVGA